MADCLNNPNTRDRHRGFHCHHYLVSTNTFLVIHNTNLKRQRKSTFKACFEKAFRKKYSVLALKRFSENCQQVEVDYRLHLQGSSVEMIYKRVAPEQLSSRMSFQLEDEVLDTGDS